MRVELKSHRIVKPKPANMDDDPPTSNILPLSNVDLEARRSFVRTIYAFEAPTPPTSTLEQSMADVLAHFRGWAGRLITDQNGRLAVHLNDEGAVLAEALADGILSDAMPFAPTPSLLQFLPPAEGVPELLLIQATRFTCGGLAIGVCIHHTIGDGVAAVDFLNCWGKMTRGEPINPVPLHDRSLLMARHPPRAIFDHGEYSTLFFNRGGGLPRTRNCKWDLVVKRFTFKGELVDGVRRMASEKAEKWQSRYVSMTAHMWRCISRARGLHGDVVSKAVVAVDGRSRFRPPLPRQYAGNVVFRACSETTVKDLSEKPLGFGANLIRDAVGRVDDEYLRSAIDYLELNRLADGPPHHTELNPHIWSTSWLSLPLYDLDFGGGSPLHVGPTGLPTEGRLIFVPPRAKDGSMDVVVCLLEPHMAVFQQICYTI